MQTRVETVGMVVRGELSEALREKLLATRWAEVKLVSAVDSSCDGR